MIGNRLKELRKENNLTQVELAKKLDVGQSTITAIESGKVMITLDKLLILSDLYNVSMDYLTCKSDIKATQAEVDFLNEIKEKGIDQIIHDYNLTLGDEAMDPKEERILIKLIKSFMEGDE